MSSINNSETSTTLLRAIAEGDQSSWVRFVEHYRPIIVRRCREFGLSAEDSDCMAQDLFLQLFRRVDAFNRQRSGSFRRWLKIVVQSRIIDALRRQKLPIEHRQDPDFVTGLIPRDLENSAEYEKKLQQVIESIRSQFSDRDWTIFYLTVGEERPAKEVALELGVSENSVYLCKSRMLKKLRQKFETGQSSA